MGSNGKSQNLAVGKHGGLSSVFLIDIEPSKNAFFYDVEIFTLKGSKQFRKITGLAVDLNRKISVELVRIALQKSGILSPKTAFVYDGRKIVYLSKELELGQNEWIVQRNEVSEFVRENFNEKMDFKVRIKPCQTGHHVLNLDDFVQYEKGNNSVDQEDRSLRTFLELAIAQKSWESGKFIAIGSGKLFNRKQEEGINFRANPAITFHSGLCKGVRIVEGPNQKGQPAVVLDVKVGAFLKAQSLEKTIADFFKGQNGQNDWQKVGQFLRGVKVQCNYDRSRIFTIGGFGDKSLKDETFTMEKEDGQIVQISVVDYLKGKYPKMILKNLNWHGMYPIANPSSRFPVEQLFVLEGQKIPQEKQTPELVDILLKKNSITPQERHGKIEKAGMELELWNGKNEVLQAFGIKVQQKSNDTNFNVCAVPNLLYKDGKKVVPSGDKADWSKNSGPFIDARGPKKWAVIFEQGNETLMETFIMKMKQKCTDKGMNLPKMNPIPRAQELFDPNTGEPNLEKWRECFRSLHNQQYEFVLLIDKKSTNSHGLLKLFEVFERPIKNQLITQQITIETVRNVVDENRWQTLDNIVNKLNIKFGGLNYRPILQNADKPDLAKFEQRFDIGTGNFLVLGYDVSHPTQKIHENQKKSKGNEGDLEEGEEDEKITSTEPSVVGICANMAENPHNFVGDYFYQTSRKESINLDQLKERSKWILANLEANRPKQCRPQYVFVVRDGLSEGQYRMAYQEELKAIKDGFLEHDPKYSPKFVLIIGTKRHNKKFFSFAQKHVENMPPCSIIQDKVVRMDLTEFYMQSHFPIKGTAKTVEYVILVNEIQLRCSMTELKEYVKLKEIKAPKVTQKELQDEMLEKSLQNLLLMLSYDHQIVSKPISLTEPVYQADELAKRGHANFATLKQYFPDQVPYSDEHRNGKRLVDYSMLTSQLSHWDDGLLTLNKRFTA